MHIDLPGERAASGAQPPVCQLTLTCAVFDHIYCPTPATCACPTGMKLRSSRRSCVPLSRKCATSCTFLLFLSFHVSGQLHLRVCGNAYVGLGVGGFARPNSSRAKSRPGHEVRNKNDALGPYV